MEVVWKKNNLIIIGPISFKKENNGLLMLIILIFIITSIYYFVMPSENSNEVKLKKMESLMGENVSGESVKELITYIKEYNTKQYTNSEENYIRLLIHLNPNYTKNKKSYYVLTGVNPNIIKSKDYLLEYLNAIKDEEHYFIKIHKYNPDGTVHSIVISDDINKLKY